MNGGGQDREDHQGDSNQDFRPWIETVPEGIRRVILADYKAGIRAQFLLSGYAQSTEATAGCQSTLENKRAAPRGAALPKEISMVLFKEKHLFGFFFIAVFKLIEIYPAGDFIAGVIGSVPNNGIIAGPLSFVNEGLDLTPEDIEYPQ